MRIILRTGQPGQAPERSVLFDYDINDYKAKTELAADKLFSLLHWALRSNQQLERMVQTRRRASRSSSMRLPRSTILSRCSVLLQPKAS